MIGAAFLDISTGEFRATQENGADAWQKIRADLESFSPRELLFPSSLALLINSGISGKVQTASLPLTAGTDEDDPKVLNQFQSGAGPRDMQPIEATLTPIEDWLWQTDECSELLKTQFGVRTLEGYGIEHKHEAVRAAGACLRYAQQTQRATAAHITDLVYFEPQDYLILDSITVRNLELVASLGGASGRSLLDVIDETVTGMGARLLRSWLLRPSVRRGRLRRGFRRSATFARLIPGETGFGAY